MGPRVFHAKFQPDRPKGVGLTNFSDWCREIKQPLLYKESPKTTPKKLLKCEIHTQECIDQNQFTAYLAEATFIVHILAKNMNFL